MEIMLELINQVHVNGEFVAGGRILMNELSLRCEFVAFNTNVFGTEPAIQIECDWSSVLIVGCFTVHSK